jgi:hypothetical protein
MGILSMATGLVLFLLTEQIKLFSESLRLNILIVEGGCFLGGLGFLLMAYLRGDLTIPGSPTAAGRVSSTDAVEYQLARLKSDIAALRADKSLGQPAISADLVQQLRESITSELTASVEQKLSSEALSKAQLQEIRSTFANSYTRLSQALSELNRRGNLNLVIGVITTFLAATVLAYTALQAPAFTTATQILAHYIPRLSTIVFIEVFSFFFLRLYKATLAESKFYQVELLSLATADIALQAALKSADPSTMVAVINQITCHRADTPATETVKKSEVDVKGLSEVLEKFARIAIEASKAKG